MCDIPFSVSICCTFSIDRLWFPLILIFCRLSLSPLFAIASMMLSKQVGEDFQSVFLTLLLVFPHNWKLNALILYLRSDPKSSAVEQWMSQPSKISLSALQLALTICPSSSSLNSKQYKNTSSVVAFTNLSNDLMKNLTFTEFTNNEEVIILLDRE